MGRRKNYDREELLSKAMDVFRDLGFSATSAETLVTNLGINRYSLYAEFGSKQALFEAALQRYNRDNVTNNFGPLESPQAGIDELRQLFESLGSANDNPAWGRGCFFCNTAVEFGPNDPMGDRYVQQYFERITAAFRNALSLARSKGQLRKSIDPNKEAGFLTSSVLGIFVMLRAKAPTATIKNAAQLAIDHLDNLSV